MGKIEEKLSTGTTNELQTEKSGVAIRFPAFYFDGLNEFKNIIDDSTTDLQQLIGDTKILMAMKNPPPLLVTKVSETRL